jgi:hypothetical protein
MGSVAALMEFQVAVAFVWMFGVYSMCEGSLNPSHPPVFEFKHMYREWYCYRMVLLQDGTAKEWYC